MFKEKKEDEERGNEEVEKNVKDEEGGKKMVRIGMSSSKGRLKEDEGYDG